MLFFFLESLINTRASSTNTRHTFTLKMELTESAAERAVHFELICCVYDYNVYAGKTIYPGKEHARAHVRANITSLSVHSSKFLKDFLNGF